MEVLNTLPNYETKEAMMGPISALLQRGQKVLTTARKQSLVDMKARDVTGSHR